jgi:polysaccharide biosynthesis protein PslH
VSGEILFLAHRVPFPPNRGDKIRSWNVLKALCKIAPVHVCALMDSGDSAEDVAAVKAIAASAHFEPASRSKLGAVVAGALSKSSASVQACSSPALAEHILRILNERPISAVYAFSGQMAQFVPDALWKSTNSHHSSPSTAHPELVEGLPLLSEGEKKEVQSFDKLRMSGKGGTSEQRDRLRFIMDFVDMDSAKFAAWAEASSGPRSWANGIEAKRLFAFETATAKRADVSVFVSDAEAALFRAQARFDSKQVQVLENGIDLVHFDPARKWNPVDPRTVSLSSSKGCPSFPELIQEEQAALRQAQGNGGVLAARRGAAPLIAFTGQMDYDPNVEAVTGFAKEAMPLIRDIHPGAQFAIVGRAPTADVLALAKLPGVIVTGAVPDTRDWLAAADVIVAPLKLARGIQNKVLEAMAMAKPVVASPAAAEGIDALHDRDLIIADGSKAQAEAVLNLLANPNDAAALGKAARAQMVARYSWDATLARLPQLMGFGS